MEEVHVFTDINKEKFTVFDCFDGTLIEYFKNASNFNFDEVQSDSIPVEEIIRRINDNEDRDYNSNVFVKRLRRIEKKISSEGRKQFESFIKDGDIGKFASNFKNALDNDFSSTMRLLNNKEFQKLLVNCKRAKTYFYVAHTVQDEVSSEMVFELEEKYLKPQEYLEAFEQFVKDNASKIEAMKVVLERPKDWKTQVLNELRNELALNHFPEDRIKIATRLVHKKHLPDIISIIKHAAKDEPILEVDERVNKAVNKVFEEKNLTGEQIQWVEYIKQHLIENLTLEKEDFDYSPIFERHGGWGRFKKLFGEQSLPLLELINSNIAA